MVVNNFVEMVLTWKKWKSEPGFVPSSDFVKQKSAKGDVGILGLAVQASVGKRINSNGKAEELL